MGLSTLQFKLVVYRSNPLYVLSILIIMNQTEARMGEWRQTERAKTPDDDRSIIQQQSV